MYNSLSPIIKISPNIINSFYFNFDNLTGYIFKKPQIYPQKYFILSSSLSYVTCTRIILKGFKYRIIDDKCISQN